MSKEKRELPYYVVGVGLIMIAIFLDVYLGVTKSTDPTWLVTQFKGTWNDWLGIILFNLGTIGLGLGMLGVWEIVTSSGSALNRIWAVALAASIGLILL